ncbi:1-deoxy-D-xylulose-5-phosphate reductoisomerase [Gilvimarinus sp. F26214L]|uniref:1-deoxy-D-xylulose-5-phosphate reductoisomerase n=1 Tax=Gilvimarinus sp. DZF01 TaxID=3461371 RepID=UPI0040465A85
MNPQLVTVLGATGSIGVSTLDVLARHPERFQVFALTANTRSDVLLEQCMACKPRYAVMRDGAAAEALQQNLRRRGSDTQVLSGEQGLIEVAAHPDVDTIMAAIVGAAGLSATLAAVQAGKRVLLANKESLVMAGALFMSAVRQHGATLLPIDSEHNAIFQCLPPGFQGLEEAGVRRILLTGSGGPFRNTPLADLAAVTPAQACKHPNWSMGPKISVDSATMMNKGLEFIEACWLFDAAPSQIEVVVHPQSMVHSMVEYVDGSVLAQLGNPDMRTPIAHALAWPERIASGVSALDLLKLGPLEFTAPDLDRFPCLRLAMESVRAGGTAQVILNAANEVAVEEFLAGRLSFTAIPAIIEEVLERSSLVEPSSIEVVQSADADARSLARELLPSGTAGKN